MSESSKTISEAEANRQTEAVKKIMADKKIPFEQALDIYIDQTKKREKNGVQLA